MAIAATVAIALRGTAGHGIAAEFGGAKPDSLSEYYLGKQYVPNHANTAGIPASGAIKFSQFRGKSAAAPAVSALTAASGVGRTMGATFNSGGWIDMKVSMTNSQAVVSYPLDNRAGAKYHVKVTATWVSASGNHFAAISAAVRPPATWGVVITGTTSINGPGTKTMEFDITIGKAGASAPKLTLTSLMMQTYWSNSKITAFDITKVA